MSNTDAFDVRCACGEVIHTSAQHIGRTIRCRCGKPVTIERPAAASPPPSFVMGKQDTRRETSRARGKRWRVSPQLLPRVQRAAEGLLRELVHPRATTRWSARAQLAYMAGLLLAWLALVTTSESWLPATLLAYGPRAVVLLPAVVVLPIGLLFARRSLVFTLLALFVAVHPVMGFRFGFPPGAGAVAPAPGSVRVVTLNAQGGGIVLSRLEALIALDADALHVQECSDPLARALRERARYQVAQYKNLCTASRWPITAIDSMPRQAFTSVARLGFGGTALVMRSIIDRPGGTIQTVNLHLETPRKGLEAVISDEGLLPDDGSLPSRLPIDPSATAGLDINATVRDRESERAAGWSARQSVGLPLIVAGDFNMPVESTIYRRHWAGYENAFEEKGLGFGYTKFEGRLLRARIDHVLTLPGTFEVTRIVVGPEVGSDHRPVIAELRLRQ